MGLEITRAIDSELLLYLIQNCPDTPCFCVVMADYFVSLIIIIATPGVWVVRAVSVTTSEWGHLSRGWWPPTSSDTAGLRENVCSSSEMFTAEVLPATGQSSAMTTSNCNHLLLSPDIKNYHVVVKYRQTVENTIIILYSSCILSSQSMISQKCSMMNIWYEDKGRTRLIL